MQKILRLSVILMMSGTIGHIIPNSAFAATPLSDNQRPAEFDDLDDVVTCPKNTTRTSTTPMQGKPEEDALRFATEEDVDAALAISKKKSPQIYEDSLRVWKNFNGKTNPNYTYRFWARDLVTWLRQNRHLSFESAAKVGRVFKILQEKKLISSHAAVVLTTDVWHLFIYQEGIPELDKHLDKDLPLHKKRAGDAISIPGKKRVEIEA